MKEWFGINTTPEHNQSQSQVFVGDGMKVDGHLQQVARLAQIKHSVQEIDSTLFRKAQIQVKVYVRIF